MLIKSTLNLAEELGAVEVGVGNVDGVPGEEVGGAEVVAALVEVGGEGEALYALDIVLEIGGVGNEEDELPGDFADAFCEVVAAEARPALDAFEDFLRGEGAGVAVLAGGDEDGACAVGLDVVIHTIVSGAGEEFYAAIFPYVSAVAIGNGGDALFRNAIIDDEAFVGGNDAEGGFRTVGIFCPVNGIDGIEVHALLVEPCGECFEGKFGEGEVIKFQRFHDGLCVCL